MAAAIARALDSRRHLVIEAPTGVGKTLAYLIPAILHATRENRKAVVSTHTKNLQQQITQRDVALARSILGIDFDVALLKGRRNYLCTTRLAHAVSATRSLFDKEGVDHLGRIKHWSAKTVSGDLEDLDFVPRSDLWDMVCSEKGICNSKTCGANCFFQRAKERARLARIVIMNHALFFTLLGSQEPGDHFLFENDFVIFDEAHTLESVAGAGIGKNISRYQVLAAIHKLYSHKTKRGLLARFKKSPKDLCHQVEEDALRFFEEIRYTAGALHDGGSGTIQPREIRIRTPYFVANTMQEPLQALQKEVREFTGSIASKAEVQELEAAVRALWEADILIGEFLAQPEAGFTYWVELSPRAGENITLCTAPVDIAETVGPRLFRTGTSVIMTSATLAVNGSLDYFRRRIGAGDVEGVVLDSPFDHARQMKLRIARDIPEPESDAFVDELPSWILHSIERSGGRALVLFTSQALMRRVAAILTDALAERGITLLVQGTGMQRHALLEYFQRDVTSVLFGLESFWMGIDVPGEALEHVIIPRLPFAVPNHPLIEARLELIARRGGNSFLEYTLPESVLKLRQGVGRLIRSKTDSGVVTILDSRILNKRYGRTFLDSLPRCPVEVFNKEGDQYFVPSDEW